MDKSEITIQGENVTFIENTIREQLARINVNVENVSLTGKYNDGVKTTSFSTVPSLFKEIHVDGYCYYEKVCEKSSMTTVKMTIQLGYRYQHWEGGNNGHTLGKIEFYLINGAKIEGKESWQNIKFGGFILY